MNISTVEGLLTISLDALGTATLALVMLLIGASIKKHVKFFRTYCIPAPVIGGTLFAIINLLLHQTGAMAINMTSSYQSDMQNIFFVAVSLGISMGLIKKGGSRLVRYFLLTTVLIVLQGAIGVAMSSVTGLEPCFGVVLGQASLAGGHGNVTAYGQFLEDMGHTGALVAGVAAATFGLITGSFFGGPLAEGLIRKYGLKNEHANEEKADYLGSEKKSFTMQDIFYHVALIGLFMSVGGWLGNVAAKAWDISIPSFTGPMLFGFIFRNIADKTGLFRLNDDVIDKIQSFSLGVFLSMAMISLKLWQLADLAVPMMIVLAVELVATLVFIRYIVFPIVGKDFDAAMLCAGLCGHGLGAAPNGLANMDSICSKYGYSQTPYIIVTITAGILASWTLLLVNTVMVNWLG